MTTRKLITNVSCYWKNILLFSERPWGVRAAPSKNPLVHYLLKFYCCNKNKSLDIRHPYEWNYPYQLSIVPLIYQPLIRSLVQQISLPLARLEQSVNNASSPACELRESAHVQRCVRCAGATRGGAAAVFVPSLCNVQSQSENVCRWHCYLLTLEPRPGLRIG